ncbi:hypothetical protein [Aliidiomarina sanyensis]|uniref:Uncharacterized protein n=1 Tax=Aliidiomarina sanyensis TaxID=1249555 RepID=A0A432WAW6_9GAMM|nr:hypothetical protein [Aliidiomarina sanyensis]RUO27520.1 hypothetical protein CWE11_11265 [Aliidiomarina sanyensis]
MKTLISLIAIALSTITLLSTPANAASKPTQIPSDALSCNKSCVELVHLGQQHLVVGINNAGEIFYVHPLNLPRDAAHIGEFSIADTQQFYTQSSGESVTSSEQRYLTASEIIVVTPYLHYDADGNLINVQVSEVRFPRDDVQEQ